jgi:hypothetical protein
MATVSAKTRMLNALKSNSSYNSFSVAQGRNRFGVKNITARIAELRKDGHDIYTNVKRRADGTKVRVYRLGAPTKGMKAASRKNSGRKSV